MKNKTLAVIKINKNVVISITERDTEYFFKWNDYDNDEKLDYDLDIAAEKREDFSSIDQLLFDIKCGNDIVEEDVEHSLRDMGVFIEVENVEVLEINL